MDVQTLGVDRKGTCKGRAAGAESRVVTEGTQDPKHVRGPETSTTWEVDPGDRERDLEDRWRVRIRKKDRKIDRSIDRYMDR